MTRLFILSPAPWAPGLVLVAVAVVLPWTSWMPLTASHPAVAVVQTPLWLFVVGTVAAIGCWIWQREPWLGAWVIYLAIRGAFYSWPHTFEVLYLSLLGVIALVAVRHVPAAWHPRILAMLLVGAVMESVYVWHQHLGYDLLWAGFESFGRLTPVGTLGNTNYVGAYLGMLLPVAPLWLMPLIGVGLFGTGCVTAMVMALAGLAVRFRFDWRWTLPIVLLSAVVLEIVIKSTSFSSMHARMETWQLGVEQMTPVTAIVGRGLGAWIGSIPAIQYQAQAGELFAQAHNEYLQLWYEMGAIGLMLVAGFLWQHRRAFLTLPGAGCAAVAVNGLTMFPFHLAITGLTALVLLGMAIRQEEESWPRSPSLTMGR